MLSKESSSMTDSVEEVVQYLAERDVGFYVKHDSPGGQRSVPIAAHQVAAYAADPTGFLAAQYGVSKEKWIGWHQAEYRVQCAGTTAKGKRCKSTVPGLFCVDSPSLWAESQGERCALHY